MTSETDSQLARRFRKLQLSLLKALHCFAGRSILITRQEVSLYLVWLDSRLPEHQ